MDDFKYIVNAIDDAEEIEFDPMLIQDCSDGKVGLSLDVVLGQMKYCVRHGHLDKAADVIKCLRYSISELTMSRLEGYYGIGKV